MLLAYQNWAASIVSQGLVQCIPNLRINAGKTRVFLLCYKKYLIFIWIGCGMRFALVVKMRDERDEK